MVYEDDFTSNIYSTSQTETVFYFQHICVQSYESIFFAVTRDPGGALPYKPIRDVPFLQGIIFQHKFLKGLKIDQKFRNGL